MSGYGKPHIAVTGKGGVRNLSFETSLSLSGIGFGLKREKGYVRVSPLEKPGYPNRTT